MTDFESNVLKAMDKMATALRLLANVVPAGGVVDSFLRGTLVDIEAAHAAVAPPEEPVASEPAEPVAYDSEHAA